MTVKNVVVVVMIFIDGVILLGRLAGSQQVRIYSVRLSVNQHTSRGVVIRMKIDKRLYLQMRESAVTTCGNAYLMADGEILTDRQYKQLDLIGKLQVELVYQYSSGKVIKI